MKKRKQIQKISETVSKRTIESVKEICKYMSVIALIPIILLFVDAALISLMMSVELNYFVIIGISIFVIIQTFIFIIKIGFKRFNEDTYLNKIFSILFGFISYFSLLFQLALVFLPYYIFVDSTIIPKGMFSSILYQLELENDEVFFHFIRLILNYIFPNFYKYPSAEGIAVTLQFFVGKFIDLFILAFIVERLKKKM